MHAVLLQRLTTGMGKAWRSPRSTLCNEKRPQREESASLITNNVVRHQKGLESVPGCSENLQLQSKPKEIEETKVIDVALSNLEMKGFSSYS